MEYESDVIDSKGCVKDHVRDPQSFYLEGKLASELPDDDSQPAATLYRAVCGGDFATVKSLLASGHNPNVPYYYYIPLSKLDILCYVGRNIEDKRGMFHYPLHRAVLLNDVELVALLLDHGADPNVIDGRSNSPLSTAIKTSRSVDTLIVEKLILSGADKEAAVDTVSYMCCGNGGGLKWSIVKTVLCHCANINELFRRKGRTFLYVLGGCRWMWNKDNELGYEILENFLDKGLGVDLLKEAVAKLVFSCRCEVNARTLIFLFQAGVPVNFPLLEKLYHKRRYYEPGHTPLQIMLKELGGRLCKLQVCGKLKSEMLCMDFRFVWLLVKAGAQLRSYKGDNICERLVLMELTLNTIYDKTERAFRDTWATRHRSYVLGQLQHCKEVMAWLGAVYPQSLLELSALAVRRSLGFFPGRTVKKLGLPMKCQDAVLLQDLQPSGTKIVL